MPDWFYRTVAQKTLFALPDRVGRGLALGLLGTLGRLGAGRALIDFLGHMEADPRLKVRLAGLELASPVGLGWRVDPEARALEAFNRFGVGCIEVRERETREVVRVAGPALRDGNPRHRRADRAPPGVVVLHRQIGADGTETVRLPDGTILPVIATGSDSSRINPGTDAGIVLQAGTRTDDGWVVPAMLPPDLIGEVRRWRERLPPQAPLIVSGGAGAPGDVVALREEGATLVLIDAGLVYHGPGLIKRSNEALLAHRQETCEAASPPETASVRSAAARAWIWVAALGAALLVGGAAALVLALTRVLLPYDEHFLGIGVDALQRNSPRLFAFMSHDRGTLAGTMIGLGAWYLILGWHAVRRAIHGAKTAVVTSALAGFASFFAFFGFGYFDTLHAFVAAILFQCTVQIVVGAEGGRASPPFLVDQEDAAWRRAQWGQLLWIVHAVGLLLAGGIILHIGMSSVFVAEDLSFLCLTEAEARALGDRTTSVVAHDRATLGGMLLASGIAMLLPILWCFRRGATWLWWGIAALGLPAYAAAIGVHFHVGYTDARHLAPALLGAALWLAGLLLTRGYVFSVSSKR